MSNVPERLSSRSSGLSSTTDLRLQSSLGWPHYLIPPLRSQESLCDLRSHRRNALTRKGLGQPSSLRYNPLEREITIQGLRNTWPCSRVGERGLTGARVVSVAVWSPCEYASRASFTNARFAASLQSNIVAALCETCIVHFMQSPQLESGVQANFMKMSYVRYRVPPVSMCSLGCLCGRSFSCSKEDLVAHACRDIVVQGVP